MSHTCGFDSMALSARPMLVAPTSTWASSSTRRRSCASANAPPTSEPAISGSTWASPSRPTISDEWVSWYTWNGAATTVTPLPMLDTICPR